MFWKRHRRRESNNKQKYISVLTHLMETVDREESVEKGREWENDRTIDKTVWGKGKGGISDLDVSYKFERYGSFQPEGLEQYRSKPSM